MLPLTSTSVSNFNFAQSFARLSQAAARPAFELQFAAAQNAVLDRLDRQISELQEDDLFLGQTAGLRIQASRLENRLPEVESYRESVTNNRTTVLDIMESLADARALADPGSVTAFDAALDKALSQIEKLQTTPFALIGISDNLLATKPQVKADLEAITTNNFATAADTAAVEAAIDAVSNTLAATLTVLEINDDMAFDQVKALKRQLEEANRRIDTLEVAERQKRLDEVNELREQASRTLTVISLGFEGGQAASSFLTENLSFDRKPPPGSVLNLFV